MEQSKRQREQQERELQIIIKAKELFCIYGYDHVSMDTIAKETEFTKRTLYRYFSSKDDLFFAIALKGHQELFERLVKSTKKGGTGFEKIRHSINAYFDFYSHDPKLAQMVNIRRYPQSEEAILNSEFYKQYLALDRILFDLLIKNFIEGQKDGSIRPDLDIHQLAFSTIYVVVGFFQMISVSGDTYPKHFGIDKDEFIKFTLERLVEPIKNPIPL